MSADSVYVFVNLLPLSRKDVNSHPKPLNCMPRKWLLVICATSPKPSLLVGDFAVRHGCYGFLRYIKESSAKGYKVVIPVNRWLTSQVNEVR